MVDETTDIKLGNWNNGTVNCAYFCKGWIKSHPQCLATLVQNKGSDIIRNENCAYLPGYRNKTMCYCIKPNIEYVNKSSPHYKTQYKEVDWSHYIGQKNQITKTTSKIAGQTLTLDSQYAKFIKDGTMNN